MSAAPLKLVGLSQMDRELDGFRTQMSAAPLKQPVGR